MSYKKSQGEEVFNFLGTYKELHQMPLFTTTKFITAISKSSEPPLLQKHFWNNICYVIDEKR